MQNATQVSAIFALVKLSRKNRCWELQENINMNGIREKLQKKTILIVIFPEQ